MNIPGPFREMIENNPLPSVVVTQAGNPCLVAYPRHEWDLIRQRTRERGVQSVDKRQFETFMRRFYAQASECEVDAQGRILIPKSLRDAARLNGDAVVVGIDFKFEIWSPQDWDGQEQAAAGDADQIQEMRFQLGM